MLRRSRFDMREDETPEPEDLPTWSQARLRKLRHCEVIAQVTRSFVESGRYSAEEVRAPFNHDGVVRPS
jgi:hypothetical protein